jgi:tetratricopeptide (TPR) repeat protein
MPATPQYFISEAEKLLNASILSPFIWMIPVKDRKNEAAEFYSKAASLFEKDNNMIDALLYYSKAYELCVFTQDIYMTYKMAENCAKVSTNNETKIMWYNLAIESALWNPLDNKNIIDRLRNEIVKIYISENNYDAAILNLKQLIDKPDRNVKIADLYVSLKDWKNCYEYYDRSVEQYRDSKLSIFSMRPCIFHSLLSLLCLGDDVLYNREFEKYHAWDYNFCNQRECKFLTKLKLYIDDADVDNISLLCREYDEIKALSPIEVNLLTTIKNNISTVDDTEEIDLT